MRQQGQPARHGGARALGDFADQPKLAALDPQWRQYRCARRYAARQRDGGHRIQCDTSGTGTCIRAAAWQQVWDRARAGERDHAPPGHGVQRVAEW